MNKIFGIVDCNNFYANCERVFQPKLKGRPIVVLSNNDGCVIARSNEAKALGVPMGEPFFKLKPLIERNGIVAMSSNYALYGDFSNRVMNVLSRFTPNTEIYSIDECFLDLTGFDGRDLTTYAREIKETVERWTGIPVCIGIAQTKTLAKLANKIAKKSPKAAGVLDLTNSPYLNHALEITEVRDVWGIGRHYAKMLKGRGIMTAYDLSLQDERWVRQKMGVVGLKTVQELRGISCIDLEEDAPDKQTTAVTRSFGKMLSSYEEVREAIFTFTARAAEKLRKADLVAGQISVFIRTNPFRQEQMQYSNSALVDLHPYTNDTRQIQKAGMDALNRIFKEGLQYKRAGILLMNLVRTEAAPRDLFTPMRAEIDEALMQAVDKVNRIHGSNILCFGQIRKDKSWYATRNHCSPKYTTSWADLPKVK